MSEQRSFSPCACQCVVWHLVVAQAKYRQRRHHHPRAMAVLSNGRRLRHWRTHSSCCGSLMLVMAVAEGKRAAHPSTYITNTCAPNIAARLSSSLTGGRMYDSPYHRRDCVACRWDEAFDSGVRSWWSQFEVYVESAAAAGERHMTNNHGSWCVCWFAYCLRTCLCALKQ